MKKYIYAACLSVFICAEFALAQQRITESNAADTKPADATPAEPVKQFDFMQAQLALYNSADKNFDGRVAQDEISLLEEELNKPKHVEAFQALDTNKNGVVSYEEIEAKYEEFSLSRKERILKSKNRIIEQYDQDQNGVITSNEINAYFEKQAKEEDARTLKQAKRDFQFKDTDESGAVTLDEYLDSKQSARVAEYRRNTRRIRRLDSSQTAANAPTHLKRDQSGDKIITRLENESFAKDLFAALDVNDDGELSGAEQSPWAYAASKRLSFRSIAVPTGQNGLLGANR